MSSATATDPFLQTLVDVVLAVLAIEPGTGTVAPVLVDEVDTLTAVQTGRRLTLVQLHFAEHAHVSGQTVTDGNLRKKQHC